MSRGRCEMCKADTLVAGHTFRVSTKQSAFREVKKTSDQWRGDLCRMCASIALENFRRGQLFQVSVIRHERFIDQNPLVGA